MVTMSDASFAFATVFMICELGQRMIDAFDNNVYFEMSRFDWYLFPIEIKRILPTIILMAQKPVSLECFGGILCTREVFKSVSLWKIKFAPLKWRLN